MLYLNIYYVDYVARFALLANYEQALSMWHFNVLCAIGLQMEIT